MFSYANALGLLWVLLLLSFPHVARLPAKVAAERCALPGRLFVLGIAAGLAGTVLSGLWGFLLLLGSLGEGVCALAGLWHLVDGLTGLRQRETDAAPGA